MYMNWLEGNRKSMKQIIAHIEGRKTLKVLLINPNLPGYSPAYPPLGLLYIAAVLKREGHSVRVMDANLERASKDMLTQRIEDNKPDVVGITMSSLQVGTAYETAFIAKQVMGNKTTVIVGGAHPTALPEQTLQECPAIDIVVVGEGEVTIIQLTKALQNDQELSDVQGIVYRKQNDIAISNPRPRLIDLDSLPFPAYEFAPLQKYFRNQATEIYRPSLAVITSRGCPFRCVFCSNPVWKGKTEFRSAQNVVDEIQWLYEKFAIKEVYFHDDTFNICPKRVEKICNEIMLRRLHHKIVWRAECRANKGFVTEALFSLMKGAGCWAVFFGVESGNQKILRLINKSVTLKEVRNAFLLAKATGLKTGGFFMIGNIGENEFTIKDTIEFAKSLNPDYSCFSVATPYPGSELFDRLGNGRNAVPNWSISDDRKTPILRTDFLSLQDLSRLRQLAIRQFYLRPKYMLYKLMRLECPRELLTIMMKMKTHFCS
jgi:radical SAM superfamily enzyme YgiQ (UPF0313 family)